MYSHLWVECLIHCSSYLPLCCDYLHLQNCTCNVMITPDARLQERLKAQKAEAASNPEYGSTYKPKSSKEDRTAKRKQILSNIGTVALL